MSGLAGSQPQSQGKYLPVLVRTVTCHVENKTPVRVFAFGAMFIYTIRKQTWVIQALALSVSYSRLQQKPLQL